MSNIEKIRRYIELTDVKDGDKYSMRLSDICAIYELINAGTEYGAIAIAFDYGRAKGYRMARAEAKA